ncbi:MAG: hypothetical protein DRJ38_04485 [Thermoprotei archaeon]|nr:MAG: hypothetical protein DRJ38_04485 [Thermoprotei archaeon]
MVRIALPDRRVRLQLVLRWRPRLVTYVRLEPVTVVRPTPAQAQCRLRFGELSRAARHFSVEEVAEMVGGEVVEVNGRKVVKLPDGRLLMKHQAFIKAMLTGWRSPDTRVHIPKWLREISRTYYTLPYSPELVKVLRVVGKK